MNNQSIIKQLKTLSIVVGLIPGMGFSGWFSEEDVEKTILAAQNSFELVG